MNETARFEQSKVALVNASGRNQRTTMRAKGRTDRCGFPGSPHPPPTQPRGSQLGLVRSARVILLMSPMTVALIFRPVLILDGEIENG